MVQLKYNVTKLARNSLATHKFTTQTHCLECRVQVEFKNLAVNTALRLSYDGCLCKEVLFQLKATFYKAFYIVLITYNHVHSCFSTCYAILCQNHATVLIN